jgi:hypothetical protein
MVVSAVPFDTLKLADRLQAGGFTSEQARAAAAAFAEVAVGADLVTKQHLDDRMITLEQRLTIRLGGTLVIAVGVLLAAARYLPATHP